MESPASRTNGDPQQSVVIPEPNVVEPEGPLRRSQRDRMAPNYLKDYCT